MAGASAKVTTSFLGGDKAPSFAFSSFLLGYQTDSYTVFAQTGNCCDSVDVGLTHTASDKLTAGFLTTLTLKDTKTPVRALLHTRPSALLRLLFHRACCHVAEGVDWRPVQG